jgi:Ca2+-binding EF-hand superfamily protein
MNVDSIARRTWKLLVLIPVAAVFAGSPGIDPKKVTAGETEAKRMLVLMDNQNGKVSKQEFMNFMEAEFLRMDINKDGQLDVKELTQYQFRTNPGVHR